ncbi:hypothetical protein LEP1GSC058_1631 [Leptospira fainei serovar Hurstbridge str. BUT 6]|uniref:Uncharacterized protein n=1 Tax=Leptospira fainei serovar Hurstbridge str. BUT 6 TaxID=1193011 RepID=S3W3Y0_9LEPT|nr:hypothetical protein LEP1GSC058_1631 [Leptospira fainei serovar Hurstbridge str. BUT 6]
MSAGHIPRYFSEGGFIVKLEKTDGIDGILRKRNMLTTR